MSDRRVILTVNANRRNLELLASFLSKAGYESVGARHLDELDEALDSMDRIDLALVDLGGFDRNIWDRCDRLRAAKIPFLIISAGHMDTIQEDSMAHGARAVLLKPLASKELLGMIRGLLGEAL